MNPLPAISRRLLSKRDEETDIKSTPISFRGKKYAILSHSMEKAETTESVAKTTFDSTSSEEDNSCASPSIISRHRRAPAAQGQFGELTFLATVLNGLTEGQSVKIIQAAESKLGSIKPSAPLKEEDL